jgi:hypothetical protein
MRPASKAPSKTGASAEARAASTRMHPGVAPVMKMRRAIEAGSGLVDLPAVSETVAGPMTVPRSVAAGTSDATIGQPGQVGPCRRAAGSAREARARAAPR